jgi:hypothetical protein
VRLHLNAFRGEPAISRFDWHFTATHSSFEPSSTDTDPVFHPEPIRTSTWPWVDHLVSGPLPLTTSRRGTPCSDSVSLRLRSLHSLTFASERDSPVHSAKGTPSPGTDRERLAHRAPTAWGRWVSGSLSLPSRGAFHLSLTVLVHYRWPGVFSLGGWSPRIPPGFLVSRGTWDPRPQPACLRLPDSHRLWSRVPTGFAWQTGFLLGEVTAVTSGGSHDPTQATPAGLTLAWFRLFRVRSPLLAESRLISLPRGTKMFQFPRLPPSKEGDGPSWPPRCRIRAPTDPSTLAAPRGLSRCAAPFFGSWPQGIHPTPTVA